jgi:hypothetical protein
LTLFVRVLRTIAAGDGATMPQMAAASAAHARHLQPTVIKLTIERKHDYPYTKGFPATLQQLRIAGCALTRFDPRWLKLTNLVLLEVNLRFFRFSFEFLFLKITDLRQRLFLAQTTA